MLADTVLPPPADLSELIEAIGARYALDYVELTDSLVETAALFRTLIEPAAGSASTAAGRRSLRLLRRDRKATLLTCARRKADASDITAGTARDIGHRPIRQGEAAAADWRGLGAALLRDLPAVLPGRRSPLPC